MAQPYWKTATLGMTESLLQEVLTEVFLTDGWEVKNMHKVDPKSENGADLELRKGMKKMLVAVKDKPKKSDIDQLMRLWKRRNEAELLYAYSKPSTGEFAKKEEQLRRDIRFLQGKELHDFLIEGESITYLKMIFQELPVIKEYSDALSIVWSCRDVVIQEKSPREDLQNIYSLKSDVMKKRAAVSVFALQYDRYVNSLLKKDSNNFPKILDHIIDNLDLVQQFAGTSLFKTFYDVSKTTPHLFSKLWKLLSQRTYWKDYTRSTKNKSDTKEVSEFTAKFWVLPNANGIGEAKALSENSMGFLSALHVILESLSRSFRDLDVAVDWIWNSNSEPF
ncbi:MAG: hypothetical protein QXU18_02305 [Thermoplasmatales archaeon]